MLPHTLGRLAARSMGLLGCLVLLASAPSASANTADKTDTSSKCYSSCANNVACEQHVLACLLGAGATRAAVERLKTAAEQYPEQPAFQRLLARAYLADDNPFWALRTLAPLLLADPGDCESRALVAWMSLNQGQPDAARSTLDEGPCPTTDSERARFLLLRALIDDAQGQPEQIAHAVTAVREVGAVYPEDRVLWEHLRRRSDPHWAPPFFFDAGIAAGFTSNASAGLPVTASLTDAPSALLEVDLFGRFVAPRPWPVVPTLEAGLKTQLFSDFDRGDGNAVEQGNNLELSLRPGGLFSLGKVRMLVGYRADLYFLNGEPLIGDAYADGLFPFYEGHRGEVEMDFPLGISAFGGFGRRLFRRDARSRWEVDGGAGWSHTLRPRWDLLLALSLRYQPAAVEDYTLTGGTLLAVTRVGLGAGFFARGGFVAGYDYYPHSAAVPGAGSGRDWLLKGTLGLWSPSWHGLRTGLTYEYSWRDTTSAVSFSYDAHRVLLGLRFQLPWDPWAPTVVRPPLHLPLDYGLAATGAEPEERIRDLLRQEETARRGASCVN